MYLNSDFFNSVISCNDIIACFFFSPRPSSLLRLQNTCSDLLRYVARFLNLHFYKVHKKLSKQKFRFKKSSSQQDCQTFKIHPATVAQFANASVSFSIWALSLRTVDQIPLGTSSIAQKPKGFFTIPIVERRSQTMMINCKM